MSCPRCEERGWPSHFASAPTCAFTAAGHFDTNNWNCATMSELRALVYGEGHDGRGCARVYGCDESVGVIPCEPDDDCGFIVLVWYKDRGRTDAAFHVASGDPHTAPLTLALAERTIAYHGAPRGATPEAQ